MRPIILASVFALSAITAAYILIIQEDVRFGQGRPRTLRSAPATSPDPRVNITELREAVLPKKGFTFPIKMGSLAKELVLLGVIDQKKFEALFPDSPYELIYLTGQGPDSITIHADNAQFWVDVLWGLGLANKSPILEEGPMMKNGDTGNFASTGGWTLARGKAMDHYSSHPLIPLTSAQHDHVKELAEMIYRPCCGNHTAFPDCNHGMAALALVQLMVSQGFSDEEIFDTVLAFNSYWFPQTYLEIGYQREINGVKWNAVDAKTVLGKAYSSASGYNAIKKQIGTIEGLNDASGGGSCSV